MISTSNVDADIKPKNVLSIDTNFTYAKFCKKYTKLLIKLHETHTFSLCPIPPNYDIAKKCLGPNYDDMFQFYATPYVVILDIPKQIDHIVYSLCNQNESHGHLTKPTYHTQHKFDENTGKRLTNTKFCMREILSNVYYPYILINTTYKCSVSKCRSSIVSHSEYFLKQMSYIEHITMPNIVTKNSSMCMQTLRSAIDDLQLHIIRESSTLR